MKNEIIVSMLNIVTTEVEMSVLQKIEEALSCKLIFVKKDEEFDKSWDGSNLGMYFYFSYFHHQLHNENLYVLSVVSDSDCYPKNDKPEPIFLDFHFQRLLQNNGLPLVLTNEEYGQFLDTLERKESFN